MVAVLADHLTNKIRPGAAGQSDGDVMAAGEHLAAGSLTLTQGLELVLDKLLEVRGAKPGK